MATGDLTFRESATGTLTAPQVAALRDLVQQLWTGALAGLEGASFRREDGVVTYSIVGKRKAAPASVPLGTIVLERDP